jgi:DNA primase
MSKSSFVDFKAIKAAFTMEQVLQHYNLLDGFKKSGDSLSGPCPIHGGNNPTQFRVSISKNIWNCFSECKHGGNCLDFISKMEKISIHAAALKAIDWFQIDQEAISSCAEETKAAEKKEDQAPAVPSPKQRAKKPLPAEETITANPPLKFRLDKLDQCHPYLTGRGLTQETITDFGIGYCSKGMMADRIAIPIHNMDGKVVAYCGRFPGEPTGDLPKYKLPQGFRKSLEIFNIDRAIQEPEEFPLVIVEGFFACMKFHQMGYRKVVALMGSSLSPIQEALLRENFHPKSQVLVLLDEDEAGRIGREQIAVRLSQFHFVKVPSFTTEGWQSEQITPEELSTFLD